MSILQAAAPDPSSGGHAPEPAKPAGKGEAVRKPDWTDPEQAEGPDEPADESGADAPRGIDTLPRPGQSPGKPDSTEPEQPPRYGDKLV